ncbi:hypothetical protein Droror1_Dr00021137 [Drosera rotundifolia]
MGGGAVGEESRGGVLVMANGTPRRDTIDHGHFAGQICRMWQQKWPDPFFRHQMTVCRTLLFGYLFQILGLAKKMTLLLDLLLQLKDNKYCQSIINSTSNISTIVVKETRV